MSLKEVDKKLVKRRQVYRPVLDNPFTNERALWPRVKDPQFVWELLNTTVLSKIKGLASVPLNEWPWDLITDYNEIVQLLETGEEDVVLYVCNRDSDVSSVLLQQIPLLCYMSECSVTLVQLPSGSLQAIQEAIASSPLRCQDGLLLLRCNDKISDNFRDQIAHQVDSLQFPWLEGVKHLPATVRRLKTFQPSR